MAVGLVVVAFETVAQDQSPSGEAEIKALAAKYQAERGQVLKSGIDKHFPPNLLAKADVAAARGEAAWKVGRLGQAAEAFRQARWQLPYESLHVPDHVASILGNMRLRHAGGVSAIAFSPDGTRLATGSADQTVKVWDLGNGHEILAYTGHVGPVRALAFSPDGKSIASGGAEKAIRIWDSASGKDILTIQGEGDLTTNLAFGHDGKHLVATQLGQKPGMLLIYETAKGKLKRQTDFPKAVHSIAFNSDGSILGAGVGDGFVRLWQYPNLVDNPDQPEYWAQQDVAGAAFIAISPDNRTLARLGDDGIKLYNLVRPGAPFQVSLPRRTIGPLIKPNGYTCAVFSGDSKTLFTGSADGTIKQWDAETAQLNGAFPAHRGDIRSLAFNTRTGQLASAGAEHLVRLWTFDIVLKARDLAGHQAPVWTAAFSPNGQRVVSASADRTIGVWDVAGGKALQMLKGHDSPVTVALFSPDGKTIASGGGDKLIKIWNAETGQPVATLAGHAGAITALDFSSDGTRLVSGSADKSAKIWDVAAAKALFTLNDSPALVTAVAFRADGKEVAIGSVDQTIRLYDAATGERHARWLAHAIAVSGLAYSPDGQWLASCGADQLARVWPVATPGLGGITLVGHTGPLSAIAFHADNRHLMTAGSDKTIKLWKIDNGAAKEEQTYRGHKDWVTSVAFSKDGYHVVSSGADRIIKVWEITGKEMSVLSEHTGSIDAVAYSPDGKLIATGASDAAIRLWDRGTGEERLVLKGHTEAIRYLMFTPDSNTLVSSSFDRSLRLWDVATGKQRPRSPGQQHSFTAMAGSAALFIISPDGTKIFTEHSREAATVLSAFDLASGKELFAVNDQGRAINSVAFSADCKWGATGALDGSVRVFDMDKRGALMPGGHWFLYEKGVGLGDLAFTPDGSMLLAGSATGDVKICLVAKKEVVKTIKAHAGLVRICQVSSDGKRFVTVGADDVIKLWDLASGTELRAWRSRGPGPERGAFTTLVFSPNDRQLAAGNANTTVFLLDVP